MGAQQRWLLAGLLIIAQAWWWLSYNWLAVVVIVFLVGKWLTLGPKRHSGLLVGILIIPSLCINQTNAALL